MKARSDTKSTASSTQSSPGSGPEVELFSPLSIRINKSLADLRQGRDKEKIEELAASILAEGQLQPGAYRDTAAGPELVFGHRRLAAVGLLNQRGHDIPFKAVRTSATDAEALRMALHENTQDENFTPIELAHNIKRVRDQYGWAGKSDTKRVAEFFGLTQAGVTQAEKLLTTPKQVQDQVHQGEMSADAALQLTNAQPEKREEVLKRARAKAEAEPQPKAKGNAQKKGKKPEPKVQGKHIRAAIAETGAAIKLKTPKLSEVHALVKQLLDQKSHPLLEALAGRMVAFLGARATVQQVVEAWEDVADRLPKSKAERGGRKALDKPKKKKKKVVSKLAKAKKKVLPVRHAKRTPLAKTRGSSSPAKRIVRKAA